MTDRRRGRVPSGLPEDADHTFDPARLEVTRRTDDARGSGTGAWARRPPPAPADDRFRPRRFIDRGGYGEVWEATQVALDRTVALKRLREDVAVDDADAERRAGDFRREALITAALEHPNVVPVYDAGEDDLGRPQLALKLVRGTTWKEMIEGDLELPLADLLARHLPILIDVAQAVAFAHSRGVIHRDIKPSQVLVGEFGEVLLVDWGLAVRFAAPCGPTETGDGDGVEGSDPQTAPFEGIATAVCPAGTPAYMAPEQTDDTPDRLGPWTDVYLLGGTLYYLLTGTPLRNGVSAAGAFLQASLGELEAPGTRAPDREIPADLESLALAALARAPGDRPTALELIAALQDHLSGAGQRRESVELTAAVSRALPAAAGSYGALSSCLSDLARASGLWSANPEIDGLRERALVDYVAAAMANGDLELARRQAERLTDGMRRRELTTEISRRARARRRTARQRRFFVGVSIALGTALLASGGKYTIDQHRARVRLAEQRNAAVAAREQAEGFAAFMLEDLTPSLEALGRLDILDQVAEESIDYYASLPADESGPEALLRRSLALRNAARVLRSQGLLDEARIALDGSLEVARELDRQRPGDPVRRAQLADRLLELGALMQRTSDPDAAIDAYRQAVALFEAVLADTPGDVELRRGLARGLRGIAFEHWARAELDVAQEAFERALAILEQLVEEDPGDLYSARLLVESYARAGGVQRDRGALGESATMTRRSLELGEALVTADPANTLNLAALSEGASALGFTLWEMGDVAGALEAYRAALVIDRQLAERDPTNQSKQRNLATTHSNVGEMLHGLGDMAGALESQRAAVAVLGPLVAANPDHAEWRYALANASVELGIIHAALGDRAAAEAAWSGAAATVRPVALERGDLYYLDTYARALLLLNRVDEARPVVDELLAKGWRRSAFLELCRRRGLAGR